MSLENIIGIMDKINELPRRKRTEYHKCIMFIIRPKGRGTEFTS